MGLDQYLSKKKNISYERLENGNTRSVDEEITFGYWRKFNALHNFIVKEFANGVDECQQIYMGEREFSRILETLRKVDAKPILAPDLLPTGAGCFFGSTEYDEWYFQNVKDSIGVFEEALETYNLSDYDIYYQASW